MPIVSTIIPTFNRARVVGRAVESAYAQTGDFELDVIVVDDGSEDDTPEVCRALLQRFPTMQVVRKANGGVSSARNAGIEVARGGFFHFLDSDDYIAPFMYSQMIAALGQGEDGADVAYCGYAIVDAAGAITSVTAGDPVSADMRERLLIGCLGPPHSFFVRRKVIEGVGLFDQSVTPCEDWDFWIRSALTGARFVHVPKPLVFYERSDDSASRNYLRMVHAAERMLEKTRKALPDPRLRIPHGQAFRQVRACMFHISYSEGMRIDLERGRFLAAARNLWAVLRQDPKTTWPAMCALTHHKRAIVRGIGALMSRPFRG